MSDIPTENIQRPELLAPAGSLQAGLTAFAYGADAVYCGLPKFNARERGENFSFADLTQLISYAKRHNKRVHVTLNTLIKPNELPEVIDMIGHLSTLNPDAVIVQDIGLLHILKNYFPEIEIHASTQMGQHNSLGANLLKHFNVKRMILERQTTFDEINQIKQHTSLPLEVFVHGALCCCRSGSCLFSSWLGGWSGNRGKCKQPCRRRYFSQQGNGFFFSPGDLCLIDHLPDLVKLGVSSLKIEGRLRGSDYVATVVSAYKLVLDAIFSETEKTSQKQLNTALNQAKKILSSSLGRRWSEGFISPSALHQVIQYKQLGGSGKPCGQITQSTERGFIVKLRGTINIGDRIRIQPHSGDEGPSLIINKLLVNKKSVPKAFANEEVFIPFNKKVPIDSTLFQVANLAPTLQNQPDLDKEIKAIIPLTLTFTGTELQIDSPQIPNWQISLPCQLEVAKKHGIQGQTVIAEWFKGPFPNWAPGNIKVIETTPLFLPSAILRQLRQLFWQEIATQDLVTKRKRYAEKQIQLAKQATQRTLKSSPSKTKYPTTIRLNKMPIKRQPATSFCTDLERWTTDFDQAILCPFTPESNLPQLRQQIKQVLKQGCRSFRLSALWQIDLFRPFKSSYPELQLTMGFPLPICNNAAIDALNDLGITRQQIWVELDRASIETLIKENPGYLELMIYGKIPLLETRAEIAVEGDFRDSYGDQFTLVNEQGLSRIYPQTIFKIPRIANVCYYLDYSHSSPNDNTETKDFNFSHDFI